MNPSQLAERIAGLAGARAAEQFADGTISAAAALELLSPAQLGSFLDDPLVRHPQVRVALAGKALPQSDYVTRRRIGTQIVDDGIDARRVARLLTRGATITLDSLEYLSAPIRQICEGLAQTLGLPATATAYVTPPGRQGLKPHTDEEDVFVLQTFGSKSWIIDSTQRQDVATAGGFPFNDQMKQLAPRILRPGDMFYMPAGTPHVATALNNLSIHITFSVERPRVRDILHRSLDAIAAESPALNRLQPWDALAQPTLAELVRALESTPREQPGPRLRERPSELPFVFWDSLHADALDVRLRAELTIDTTEEGYALRFPDFTMKVERSIGDRLRPLTGGGILHIESQAYGLWEILFHLIGRDAVSVVPAHRA